MKKVFISLIPLFFLFLVGCASASGTEKEEINYGEELENVVTDIVSNGAKAEDMINAYAIMWDGAISQDLSEDDAAEVLGVSVLTVRDHFEVSSDNYGGFSIDGDFNSVLASLKAYYSTNGSIEEIEAESDRIGEKLKELNTPSEEYEKVYDEVVQLYTLSEEFYELAISPSGSLVTYNEKIGQLSSDIVSKVKSIEVIMPAE
ncbi:hypothetical protein GCM10007216_18320 [Thalassobacillus devorans]|uniref:Uncharacterized protein n=1 Tax=Thalassobacillus devorans TaxID=279813 RepID=A0ABQ1P0B3_9BACI|nr:hypothetical protein [Thalassobacillus devorans]NIK28224.1 hypothetical protein [Thalassobacillus devorans]GGC87907.1 hypothetical protein GCM10007216_18320 [Thalassobacillus devorans]